MESPGETTPEDGELYSSLALCILCLLLLFAFWTSYWLKMNRVQAVHETIVSVFAGMFVGLIIRLASGSKIQGMISFQPYWLMNFLLPPIILNSGYELKQQQFFANIFTIMIFAFLGCFISAVALGVLTYLWSLIGLEKLDLTMVECLMFGSTLSATDPVTILAIFNAYKVDPKLYTVIFGESILNDAVAIVMFQTLMQYHGSVFEPSHILKGFISFAINFSVSLSLGIIIGLLCSLMLKHSSLYLFPMIESCMVALIAFTSYFFSNGITMSGIVSLLFCGITLKHYAYHNMSRRTQRTIKYLFATLAQLCENFIFIYLGLSLFTEDHLVYKPLFILFTAFALCVARYVAVFPISAFVNFVYQIRDQRNARAGGGLTMGSGKPKLPWSYQMMLFWAGLRGAVGVALAHGLKVEANSPTLTRALKTTVLVSVVLTVIVFGGTTSRMLEIMEIRMGVQEDDDSESEDEYAEVRAGTASLAGYPTTKYTDTDHAYTRAQQHYTGLVVEDEDEDEDEEEGLGFSNGRGSALATSNEWFSRFDERYLLPIFSNSVASRRHAARKASRKRARQQVGEGNIRHSRSSTGSKSGAAASAGSVAAASNFRDRGGSPPTRQSNSISSTMAVNKTGLGTGVEMGNGGSGPGSRPSSR